MQLLLSKLTNSNVIQGKTVAALDFGRDNETTSESSDQDSIDGDAVPAIARDEELLLEFERVIMNFAFSS